MVDVERNKRVSNVSFSAQLFILFKQYVHQNMRLSPSHARSCFFLLATAPPNLPKCGNIHYYYLDLVRCLLRRSTTEKTEDGSMRAANFGSVSFFGTWGR